MPRQRDIHQQTGQRWKWPTPLITFSQRDSMRTKRGAILVVLSCQPTVGAKQQTNDELYDSLHRLTLTLDGVKGRA